MWLWDMPNQMRRPVLGKGQNPQGSPTRQGAGQRVLISSHGGLQRRQQRVCAAGHRRRRQQRPVGGRRQERGLRRLRGRDAQCLDGEQDLWVLVQTVMT